MQEQSVRLQLAMQAILDENQPKWLSHEEYDILSRFGEAIDAVVTQILDRHFAGSPLTPSHYERVAFRRRRIGVPGYDRVEIYLKPMSSFDSPIGTVQVNYQTGEVAIQP